ncbi:D-alanyl-D-alanine carboxypeptidase [Patescibacteria group bacterium]|nr:MAG: D-alanyl-D-alanine carboxypeptidase [Patescibacteria group bacterium]
MNPFALVLQILLLLAAPHVVAEAPARLVPAAPAVRPAGAPTKVRAESLGMAVTAKSAVVADAASGLVLYEKAAGDAHAIASLTKLMTALVVLESGVDFDARYEIRTADQRGGGVEYFIPGEDVSVGDLWNAALVGSSNTATVALARSTGFTDEAFVARMNAKAQALGMMDARFTEPTGLDEANRATAQDVLLLARAAFAMDDIRQTVIKEEVEVVPANPKNRKRRILKSTDQLLGTFLSREPYAIRGGKTGSLGDEVGYHLAIAVSHERTQQVYVVVLGSQSPATRFADAKALAVWAFDAWRWPEQTALR